jgi:hypothetical protein
MGEQCFVHVKALIAMIYLVKQVLHVIVTCIVGLFEDKYIIGFAKFLEWYKLVCHTQEYSKSTL